jgi:integrase
VRHQELCFSAFVLGAAIASDNCRHAANMRLEPPVFQPVSPPQSNRPATLQLANAGLDHMVLSRWPQRLRLAASTSWSTSASVRCSRLRSSVKRGTPSTHPIMGDELRALRRLHREQEPKSPFVFTSERAGPFTTAGFARMMERAGIEAEMPFKVHPHMLRHACGFALANKGHDTRALQAYLGHRNIQHTVRYTELSPTRFKDFWRR